MQSDWECLFANRSVQTSSHVIAAVKLDDEVTADWQLVACGYTTVEDDYGSRRDDLRYKCTVNILPPTYNHVVIIKTKSTCGNRSISLPRDNASHSNYFPPADLPTSESLFIGSRRSSRSPSIRIRHLTSRTFLFSSNRWFVITHTLFPLASGNYRTKRCTTQRSL